MALPWMRPHGLVNAGFVAYNPYGTRNYSKDSRVSRTHSAKKQGELISRERFREGDRVEGEWRKGDWKRGTVIKINKKRKAGGPFQVLYDHEDAKYWMKEDKIRSFKTLWDKKAAPVASKTLGLGKKDTITIRQKKSGKIVKTTISANKKATTLTSSASNLSSSLPAIKKRIVAFVAKKKGWTSPPELEQHFTSLGASWKLPGLYRMADVCLLVPQLEVKKEPGIMMRIDPKGSQGRTHCLFKGRADVVIPLPPIVQRFIAKQNGGGTSSTSSRTFTTGSSYNKWSRIGSMGGFSPYGRGGFGMQAGPMATGISPRVGMLVSKPKPASKPTQTLTW